MKTRVLTGAIFLLGTFCRSLAATPQTAIAPDDPAIAINGVFFPARAHEVVTFSRFDPATLASPDIHFDTARAQPATGAVLRFTTASAHIGVRFRAQPGENRGSEFGVFRDGALVQEPHFAKDKADLSFAIVAPDDHPATYEIALPSWASVGFLGLQLDAGARLLPNPDRPRKTYVAIGDSITHGTGQGSAAYKTYPFLAARALNWELFNLAVGGGKTSPALGAMLAGKRVDVVTILIGYNDWNTHADAAVYAADYAKLLNQLRRTQPDAAIFCITPTRTKNTVSRTKQATSLEAFRTVVRDAVRERTAADDHKIFLIEGTSLTDEADFRDTVHLNDEGAQRVAAALASAIRKLAPSVAPRS